MLSVKAWGEGGSFIRFHCDKCSKPVDQISYTADYDEMTVTILADCHGATDVVHIPLAIIDEYPREMTVFKNG